MLIANRVEGVPSGSYAVDVDCGLSLLRSSDFAVEAGHLALDQQTAADAAINLYFVASQADVSAAMGERGYRAVQLEAGVRTGQAYLAATALGLKATGLTFYDDEVASFFGLDPAETLVLMLVAFGS
jgi:nitroreductase